MKLEDLMAQRVIDGRLNALIIHDFSDNNHRLMPYVKLRDGSMTWIKRNGKCLVQINEIIKALISLEARAKTLRRMFIDVIDNIEFFESFNGGRVYLPKKISPDLLYFVGVVAGDGSLPVKAGKGPRKHVVVIEKKNEKFIKNVLVPMTTKLFGSKWTLSKRNRKDGREIWSFYKQSKPLYRFISRIFEIPEGKKSHKVRIPSIVREMDSRSRIPFVAGVMDTDWGSTGNYLEGHMASRKMLEDIGDVISELTGNRPKIRRITQGGRFRSYQIVINRKESTVLESLNRHFPFKNDRTISMLRNG